MFTEKGVNSVVNRFFQIFYWKLTIKIYDGKYYECLLFCELVSLVRPTSTNPNSESMDELGKVMSYLI